MKPRQIAEAQQGIIAWVREKTAELHSECPDQSSKAQMPNGFRNERRAAMGGVDLRLQRETHWDEPGAVHGESSSHRRTCYCP